MAEINLLQIQRGLVVAPAGCGKTHLIAETLKSYSGDKPVLILTHTNAGVGAIRERLHKIGVSRRAYRLATLDGWAMRLVSTFPERAGYDAGPEPSRPNYNKIRESAIKLLKEKHISDVLQATYEGLVIDEYQDCSIRQHAIVFYAAATLPVRVLGDPLQAIFGFGDDPLAGWEKHVRTHFPLEAELSTPWRWRNADNEELGAWLLDAREPLLAGNGIDVRNGPACVRWEQLSGESGADHLVRVSAAKCQHKTKDETVLIIGNSRSADSRYKIAKAVPGIVAIEPVDLKDLVQFSTAITRSDKPWHIHTLKFAGSLMTNVGADDVIARVQTILDGRQRKDATALEQAALDLAGDPSLPSIAKLLSCCSAEPGTRTYRPGVLRACFKALEIAGSGDASGFESSAIRVREENRAVGRQLPKSAIGSTLLLKGLEADHVVVLDADGLDSVQNIYVAITRGSKSITICSKNPVLGKH